MGKRNRFGFFVLLSAAFFYASYGIFCKIIGNSFEPFTQAWTRGALTLVCFLILGFVTHSFTSFKRKDSKWLLIIGITAALSMAPTYYSLVNLHIGTALFIQYAATLITSYILGALLLHEKLFRVDILSLFFAFLGLLMVYWGDFKVNQILPVLAAILSGVFFSIFYVFSKKINNQYSSIQINVVVYFFTVVINIIIALILQEKFNSNFVSIAWLGNIGYGIAGFLGAGLTLYGFKFMNAHQGSLVLLSEIVFGTLFGLFLFGEKIGLSALAGGGIIILAMALPNIQTIFPNTLVRQIHPVSRHATFPGRHRLIRNRKK